MLYYDLRFGAPTPQQAEYLEAISPRICRIHEGVAFFRGNINSDLEYVCEELRKFFEHFSLEDRVVVPWSDADDDGGLAVGVAYLDATRVYFVDDTALGEFLCAYADKGLEFPL